MLGPANIGNKIVTFEHPVRSPTFYPIRWIENLLISLALDPETTKFYHDYMTVRWAVRVVPGIRPRTLHRAFDKLVAINAMQIQHIQQSHQQAVQAIAERNTVVDECEKLKELLKRRGQ